MKLRYLGYIIYVFGCVRACLSGFVAVHMFLCLYMYCPCLRFDCVLLPPFTNKLWSLVETLNIRSSTWFLRALLVNSSFHSWHPILTIHSIDAYLIDCIWRSTPLNCLFYGENFMAFVLTQVHHIWSSTSFGVDNWSALDLLAYSSNKLERYYQYN